MTAVEHDINKKNAVNTIEHVLNRGAAAGIFLFAIKWM